MADVNLDILIFDTHNPYILGIGDLSSYPAGFAILSPSVQITPPGYNSIVVDFTPSNVSLYDSLNLNITCDGEDKVCLPDGLYTIKYTITPAYTYFVEKTFMRVDNLMESLDSLFMSLDIAQCDKTISDNDSRALRDIDMYIQFAISSANKCANIYAIEAYQKAIKLINQYKKSHCVSC